MECPKCGYVLDAFQADCPRCTWLATHSEQKREQPAVPMPPVIIQPTAPAAPAMCYCEYCGQPRAAGTGACPCRAQAPAPVAACTLCRTSIVPGSAFCAGCGAQLAPEATPADSPPTGADITPAGPTNLVQLWPTVLVAVAVWFVFGTGGLYARYQAVKMVKRQQITVRIDGADTTYSVPELINVYNLERNAIQTGLITTIMDQDLTWETIHQGNGKILVTCTTEGQDIYTFTVFHGQIDGANDNAEELLGLEGHRFGDQRPAYGW